jgi:hypothetical protein
MAPRRNIDLRRDEQDCFNRPNDQLDPQVRGVLRYTDDVNQPNTTALTKRMAFISQDLNLTELVSLIAQPVPGPALFFAWKSVFKHAPANQITDP